MPPPPMYTSTRSFTYGSCSVTTSDAVVATTTTNETKQSYTTSRRRHPPIYQQDQECQPLLPFVEEEKASSTSVTITHSNPRDHPTNRSTTLIRSNNSHNPIRFLRTNRIILIPIMIGSIIMMIGMMTFLPIPSFTTTTMNTVTTSIIPTTTTTSTANSKSHRHRSDDDDDTVHSTLSSSSVPFQHIERHTYHDPITNFMDPTLFHDDLLEKTSSSSASSSNDTLNSHPHFIFPYPTGSFWTNFVLPPTADFNLSYPMVVYPYAYKWSNTKLIVSYPSLHRSILGNKAIHDYFFPDLSFGLLDTIQTFDTIAAKIRETQDPLLLQNIPTSIVDRKIIHFDPLSITLRYYTTTTTTAKVDHDNFWDVYLVQGSPYVTMKYHSDALPYIKAFTTFTNIQCLSSSSSSSDESKDHSTSDDSASSLSVSIFGHVLDWMFSVTDHNGRRTRRNTESNDGSTTSSDNNHNVCSVVDVMDSTSKSADASSDSTNNEIPLYRTLRGQQFIIETQEGVRWLMFTSNTVLVTMDMHQRTLISITTPSTSGMKGYTGVIRYAVIPPPTMNESEPDTTSSSTSTASDSLSITSGIQRLMDHASIYPISAKVDWTFRTGSVTSSPLSQQDATDDLQPQSPNNPVGTMVHSVSATVERVFHLVFGTKSSTTTATKIRRTNQPSSGAAPDEIRIGTIEFQFTTESFSTTTSSSSSPSPELLMLALPHHLEGLTLSQSSKMINTKEDESHTKNQMLTMKLFDLIYKCIKGPMQPVIGSQWMMDIPLPSLGFDGDSGSNDEKLYLSPSVRDHILQNLQADIKLSLPSTTEDIYGFGKQAARLAQLAHISHLYMIGDNATKSDDGDIPNSVYKEATVVLRTTLVGLLTGKVSDRLVYDANLGGMVTTDGLTDSHADFGNGRYNDHHFHYGYLLYACAIMGKIDPTFVEEFGDHVDSIFYDIANYNNFDAETSSGAFFPGARHKIWFDGHSYASGMFPFGNGKSQESSSEAVNGYYGAYLWSLVRHGAANDPSSDTSTQTDFARLLLATEIRGAKLYWHMMPTNALNAMQSAPPVYPPEFAMNYMVGNIGMLDALCSTWFGNEELYVHMINFIPVTSATGELFRVTYIEQEYTNTLKPLGEVEMAWRGYVVADHAIVAPNTAWKEAEQLESAMLDSALSKTQVLFWIATRSGFKASAISAPSSPATKNSIDNKQKAMCSTFPSCTNLGLVGDCCPTTQGSFLECCQV